MRGADSGAAEAEAVMGFWSSAMRRGERVVALIDGLGRRCDAARLSREILVGPSSWWVCRVELEEKSLSRESTCWCEVLL